MDVLKKVTDFSDWVIELRGFPLLRPIIYLFTAGPPAACPIGLGFILDGFAD